jgi:hypothetical protein
MNKFFVIFDAITGEYLIDYHADGLMSWDGFSVYDPPPSTLFNSTAKFFTIEEVQGVVKALEQSFIDFDKKMLKENQVSDLELDFRIMELQFETREIFVCSREIK